MIKKPDLKGRDEQDLWEAMCTRPEFQYKTLQGLHTGTENALRRFWGRLRKDGVIKECARRGQQRYYTVQDQPGVEALRKRSRTTIEGTIWAALRTLREFAPEDVLASLVGGDVEPPINTIRTYCRRLTQAGYLKVLRPAKAGVRSARYRLTKNTGPLPPEIKHRLVVNDLNEDRVVYVEGAQL